MIRAYVGKLGAGKTYAMVADARREFLARLCQVYTDMRSLRFPEQQFLAIDRLEDLRDVRSGLILLDEAQIGLSSRFWQKVPADVLHALAQLRKNGLDLYYTTQDLSRVDNQLRQITNEVVTCHRFRGFFIRQHRNEGQKRGGGISLSRFDPKIGELYDTLEVLTEQRLHLRAESPRLREARAAQAARGSRKRGRSLDRTVWCRTEPGGFCLTNVASRAIDGIQDRSFEAVPFADDRRMGYGDVESIVKRFLWLRDLGLRPDQVHEQVTFSHPWQPGFCPCCESFFSQPRNVFHDEPAASHP